MRIKSGTLLIIAGTLFWWSISDQPGQTAPAPTRAADAVTVLSPASALPLDNAAIQTGNILKSGDRISVTVLGFPDLSGEQVILTDGTIQMQLLGNVNVRGLTPTQVANQLMVQLQPYVRRPQVSVVLLGIRPLQISVTGEVRRPGPLVMTALEANRTQPSDVAQEEYTLSYALVLAGGLTPDADLRNIRVRRQEVTQISGQIQSEPTELRVNLWEMLQSGSLASDLRLQDGDEIVVPTASISPADQQQLLASSLAPATIAVQVGGEVNRPGQIEIAPNASVSTAVVAAGGLTNVANGKQIQLLRMSPEGRLEHQTYEFGEDSIPLQDGDVIVVEKSTARGVLEVVGQILGPLSILRGLFY